MKKAITNMDICLIILFVMDKMEVPLTKDTLLQLCSQDNDWLNYMDCASAMQHLLNESLIVETEASLNRKETYLITTDGRECLTIFYNRIPFSLRNEIIDFIKKNRLDYRKIQEYFSDYQKNPDGTYTVTLRVQSLPQVKTPEPRTKVDKKMLSEQTIMDIKLNVENKETADKIYKSWINKGASVYEALHDILIDH